MVNKTITISLPADVLAALDARAKRIGFSRGKLLEDLLIGASGLMDEMLRPDAGASVPVEIGFRPQAVRAYGKAAKILNTTPQALIARTLEIGEKSCIETVQKFERAQEDRTKVH